MSKEHSAMAQSALVIDCRQVTRTYNEGPGKLTIFSDISLEVAQGETVAIVGSSGAGKTTLTRGFMRAFGYVGAVKSPTYTLVEPYELENVSIYHFDLYRLADPEELEFMGIRDYFGTGNIALIEWSENGAEYLASPDIVISINIVPTGRQFSVEATSVKGAKILQGCKTL